MEFLKEEIETSVRIEPGVLSIFAMADSKIPNKITLLEIYANLKASESDIASEHFQKYKIGTKNMVESLKLSRVDPVNFNRK